MSDPAEKVKILHKKKSGESTETSKPGFAIEVTEHQEESSKPAVEKPVLQPLTQKKLRDQAEKIDSSKAPQTTKNHEITPEEQNTEMVAKNAADTKVKRREMDPLLESLVMFTKLHGRPYSADALTAGLPVPSGETYPELFSLKGAKGLFSRAAERAGFSSRLVKKPLREISPLVLPCILPLKDQNACILERLSDDGRFAKIILPELGEVENWVAMKDLEQDYLGHVFYLKKEFRFEERAHDLLNTKNEHWFWGTIKKSLPIYRDVLIASFLINLFVLATPLFTMNVYDRVVPNHAIETLWVLAIGAIVIFILDTGLKFLRGYFLEMAGKKSDIIVSSMVFEKIMDMQMSSQPKSIGTFASYIREFDQIRNFLSSSTIAILIDLPFVIIFLIVIFHISGSIVFVPVTIIFLIFIFTFAIRAPLQRSIEQAFESSVYKNSIMFESLNTIETLKILGAVGHAQWKWEEATGDIAHKSIKYKMLSSAVSNVTGFLSSLATVVTIIVGVYMITDGDLTMGGLIAAFILGQRAIAPIGKVAGLITTYEQVKSSYASIQEIMDMPVEHPAGQKFVERPKFKGSMEFKNVSFNYPESKKGSLHNINLKINHGEHVGIIGKSGSGKTTLEKLIMGLYKPTEGAILIDGIDINQIDPADLRKNIGYVPQDVMLFSGTVKENIAYRAPHADDSMIIKAAQISGTLDFINKHPLGFDLPVGEGGRGLSGGQRQSISIARAFLLDSPFVLLDEPTNSMDNSSEAKIIRELKFNLKGKTAIITTHKFALLELCERLVVMDDGKIIMDGKKEEVLKKLTGK